MATLINGNGNLAIYAQQDADWYAALMGGQTVITAVGNQFAYELLAANTIGVKDGVIITSEGRRIQLDANAIDSFDIPTGAQGTTNYYIIGYHLVTGNQSEQTCETFVQLMENGTDTIPEGSFRDGDDEVFISLYRVEQDDLTIGTITALLPQLSGSFQSQITELNNDLTVKYENGKTYVKENGSWVERSFSVKVDLKNYLHCFSNVQPANLPQGATYGTTYTATKKCYLFGMTTNTQTTNTTSVMINDIFGISGGPHADYGTDSYVEPLELSVGDTVRCGYGMSGLFIVEEATS